jgi:hypothetical protein
MSFNNQNLYSFGTSNGNIPKEGPRVIPVNLDFSAQATYNVDLTTAEANGLIKTVQSIFFDNSQNAATLTIICNGSGQHIVLPANSQGTLPILQKAPSQFTISCAGGALAQILFTNMKLPAEIYLTTNAIVNSSGAQLGAILGVDYVGKAGSLTSFSSGFDGNITIVEPVANLQGIWVRHAILTGVTGVALGLFASETEPTVSIGSGVFCYAVEQVSIILPNPVWISPGVGLFVFSNGMGAGYALDYDLGP